MLLAFFFICAVVSIVGIAFRILRKQVKKNTERQQLIPKIPPTEIAALVSKLAQEVLEIGAHQLDEPIEKLRITKGDFLSFLDNLELDHGLQVPASARTMSTSISRLISALCRGA
ncbi:hypothetical protein [Luteolibacter sp. Populi]|uniref:hypothetical protein n=1 Tax=Luteolibacter sp. Populi TaxID=3230487 RepID=UPI0034665BCA